MSQRIIATPSNRPIGPFCFDLYLTVQGIDHHQQWLVETENELRAFRLEAAAQIAQHLAGASSCGEFAIRLTRHEHSPCRYHANDDKEIVQG